VGKDKNNNVSVSGLIAINATQVVGMVTRYGSDVQDVLVAYMEKEPKMRHNV